MLPRPPSSTLFPYTTLFRSTAVFPTNKQNEPTLAVSPTDADVLIAGANDEQEQPPCGPGRVRGADALPNDCAFFPGVGTSRSEERRVGKECRCRRSRSH